MNIEELWHTEHKALRLHAWLSLHHNGDADDACMQAWTNLMQAHSEGKQIDNPRAYLWRTLRNHLVDMARDRQRQHRWMGEVGVLESFDTPASPIIDPIHTADARLALGEAIAPLAVRQQQAVILRYAYDMPLREIAQEMDTTEGGVKALLNRAVTTMRKEMG